MSTGLILVLAPHLHSVYHFRKEVLQAFLDRGHQVTVAVPSHNQIHLLTAMGCRVIPIDVPRRSTNPLLDAILLVQYFRLIQELRPEHVFTYTVKPNIYGGIAARMLHVKALANITGTGSTFLGHQLAAVLIRALYRIGLRKAAVVFFQNSGDLLYFRKERLIHGRAVLLPGSGVNLQEFEYSPVRPRESVKFLFLGRLIAHKGVGEFIDCAKIITNRNPLIEFHVAGAPDENGWDERLRAAEQEGALRYHGFRTDVSDLLHQADCLVVPSHGGEGVPNVILEAAAIGRPCIASDISGTEMAVLDGTTGFKFPPGDKSALLHKLEMFAGLSPQVRRQMGAAARRLVEDEFSRDLVVGHYLKEVERLCHVPN